ncbi:protein trichome birefringence-like 43 [Dorcoceras hygrometricum]|uniref:Protein trichome birefringence-like 43 n=1 Tax=Dorcoceras hygrometricum TaxID=472368 RepID=A0A2Z7D3R6_9LAMI|nr:protein trichome birefringence-like 43 [Dorcoceras hygrometricum]
MISRLKTFQLGKFDEFETESFEMKSSKQWFTVERPDHSSSNKWDNKPAGVIRESKQIGCNQAQNPIKKNSSMFRNQIGSRWNYFELNPDMQRYDSN